MLVSYACKYSEVINCDTNELLPTAAAPNIRTRYGIEPGLEVLLSRLDARLHVADVLAEPAPPPPLLPLPTAVKCSLLCGRIKRLRLTSCISHQTGKQTTTDSDTSCGKHSNQLIHAPGIGAGHTRVGPAASALQRIPAVYNPLAGDGEVSQSVVLLFDARVGHRGHP